MIFAITGSMLDTRIQPALAAPLVKSYEAETAVYQMCVDAQKQIEANNFGQARDILTNAANSDPTSYSLNVHLELADAYRGLKDYGRAMSEAAHALQFKTNSERALYTLAITANDMGDYEKAHSYLLQLQNATSDSAWKERAKTKLKEISVFRDVKKAEFLIHAGRSGEAEHLLEAAAAFDPTPMSGGIHGNLAYCLERSGKPQRAIAEGKKALQFNPTDVHTVYTVGIAYQDIGDFDESISWLKKYSSMETDPSLREMADGFVRELADDRVKLDPTENKKPDYLDQLRKNNQVNSWSEGDLPLKVWMSSGKGVKGYRPVFRNFVVKAYNTWCSVSDNKLSYKLVDSQKDANIRIIWTNDPLTLQENGRTRQKAGLTDLQTDGNQILNATVRIRTVNGFDASRIVTDGECASTTMHEIGHSLGLGHSALCSDIMYFGSSSMQNGFPTKRDKATIVRLYANLPRTDFKPVTPPKVAPSEDELKIATTTPPTAPINTIGTAGGATGASGKGATKPGNTANKSLKGNVVVPPPASPDTQKFLPPPAFMAPEPPDLSNLAPPMFMPPPIAPKEENLTPPLFVPPPANSNMLKPGKTASPNAPSQKLSGAKSSPTKQSPAMPFFTPPPQNAAKKTTSPPMFMPPPK